MRTGRRKAAIALVALGAERAASLLRDLDEIEIKAIAAYLGSLPGDLKTVQQPRFR